MGNKQTQPLVISRPTKYEEPLPDINILSLKNNINDKSVLKIIILHLYFDNNFPHHIYSDHDRTNNDQNLKVRKSKTLKTW